MPWTAKSFKEKHNKRLTDAQAKKASSMANAMLKAGVPEGIAIATANKHAHHQSATGMMRKIYGDKH